MPKIQYRQDFAGDSNSSKSSDINNITRIDFDSKEIKPKGDAYFGIAEIRRGFSLQRYSVESATCK